MRKRTRYSFSYGSMWMSEAPRLMASVSTRFTSLTTGASSAPPRAPRRRAPPPLRGPRGRRVAAVLERSSMTFFSSMAWVEP